MIIVLKHGTKGFTSFSSILIGIIVGYVLVSIMAMVLPTTFTYVDDTGATVEATKAWVLNWDKVAQAKWFAVPALMPVKWVFDARAIVPILIMFIEMCIRDRNGHYHRSSRGGGEWAFFDLPHQWELHYKDLTFNLKPFSFKHTGLFPEQAVNWDWFGEKIRNAGRPIKVLNLFAYTGGATLAAAAAGASVTHVDASKGMVNWAKENACLLYTSCC